MNKVLNVIEAIGFIILMLVLYSYAVIVGAFENENTNN